MTVRLLRKGSIVEIDGKKYRIKVDVMTWDNPCPVCKGDPPGLYGAPTSWLKELHPSEKDRSEDYVWCDKCFGYEAGMRYENEYIFRIGVSVAWARNPVHIDNWDRAIHQLIKETQELIKFPELQGFLRRISENAHDNAVYAIMYDWLQEREGDPTIDDLVKKIPTTMFLLKVRRCKALGIEYEIISEEKETNPSELPADSGHVEFGEVQS